MKDMIVYHGSRGGIEGEIRPSSRARCDFGRGFYMGTNQDQAKGLVVSDSSPYFYRMKVHLSDVPEDRILRLNGKEWLYTVLACRKTVKQFEKLPVVKECLERLSRCDFVIRADC